MDMVTITVEYSALVQARIDLSNHVDDCRKRSQKEPLDTYWRDRTQELQRALNELDRAMAAKVCV